MYCGLRTAIFIYIFYDIVSMGIDVVGNTKQFFVNCLSLDTSTPNLDSLWIGTVVVTRPHTSFELKYYKTR